MPLFPSLFETKIDLNETYKKQHQIKSCEIIWKNRCKLQNSSFYWLPWEIQQFSSDPIH